MKTKSKSSFRESVVCTAVFALIFGALVACGGGNMRTVIGGIPGVNNLAKLGIRSFVRAGGSIGGGQGGRSVAAAAMFATPATASQLPESWQAGCADLSNNFTHLRYVVMTTETGTLCGDTSPNGVNGVLTRDQPTATDVPNGPAVNFDGTLDALVVTAQVDGIGEVKCRNIVDSAALLDGAHIQPWYDTETNTVLFTAEHVLLNFNCSLPGIPAGATGVHRVVIKFSKS